MESFGDKFRAWVLAVLVHIAVVALLFAGLLWTQTTRPISLPGPVIEAELVGISAAPKPHAVGRRKPAPPKPVPQAPEPPKPPQAKPEPATQPVPDRIEREKIAEMAQQKADEAQRAEQERHRQEQVLLQQQQERERLKQLAQIKREREAADRKLKLETEKLAQLKDLQKQPKPTPTQPVPQADQAKTGTNGSDDSLQAQYFAAIQNAVTNNWLRPDSAQSGLRCMLRIVQIPGGDVIGVQLLNPCNADALTRASIEQAVKRAAPLPYKGYEKAFQREIDFNFTYDG